MKRHNLLALVIAGIFLAASAGLVMAGGGHESSMSGEAMGSSGSWSWYTEGPVETGSIAEPPPAGVQYSEGSPSLDEGLTVQEFGGLKFREGIDTQ